MNLTPTFYISKIKTSTRARVKATCGKSKQKPTEKTKRRLEGRPRGRRTRRHGGRTERRPKPRRLRRGECPGGGSLQGRRRPWCREPAGAARARLARAVRIRQRHQTPGRHWSCALVGGTEVGSGRTGGTVTETGSRRGGGRDGGGAQGRSFENGCPAPPKRSPGYREKQASSSGLGLSRNRKLQKTDYPGQKKKERSLWDLLDSLGQNDAQLRVKLVMNVGLKLEITKNKPRGIHRQR